MSIRPPLKRSMTVDEHRRVSVALTMIQRELKALRADEMAEHNLPTDLQIDWSLIMRHLSMFRVHMALLLKAEHPDAPAPKRPRDGGDELDWADRRAGAFFDRWMGGVDLRALHCPPEHMEAELADQLREVARRIADGVAEP